MGKRLAKGELALIRNDLGRFIRNVGDAKLYIRLKLKGEATRRNGIIDKHPSKHVTRQEMRGRIAEINDKRYILGMVYRTLEKGY